MGVQRWEGGGDFVLLRALFGLQNYKDRGGGVKRRIFDVLLCFLCSSFTADRDFGGGGPFYFSWGGFMKSYIGT